MVIFWRYWAKVGWEIPIFVNPVLKWIKNWLPILYLLPVLQMFWNLYDIAVTLS